MLAVILSGNVSLFMKCLEVPSVTNTLKILSGELKQWALASNNFSMCLTLMNYQKLDVGMHQSRNRLVAITIQGAGLGVMLLSMVGMVGIMFASGGLGIPFILALGATLSGGVVGLGGGALLDIEIGNYSLKTLIDFNSIDLLEKFRKLNIIDIEVKEHKAGFSVACPSKEDILSFQYKKSTLLAGEHSLFAFLGSASNLELGKNNKDYCQQFVANKVQKGNLDSVRYAISNVPEEIFSKSQYLKSVKSYLNLIDTFLTSSDDYDDSTNSPYQIIENISQSVSTSSSDDIPQKLQDSLTELKNNLNDETTLPVKVKRQLDCALLAFLESSLDQNNVFWEPPNNSKVTDNDDNASHQVDLSKYPVLQALIQVKHILSQDQSVLNVMPALNS